MTNKVTELYESKTEKDIFQSFGYTKVISDFDKMYALSRVYENNGFFGDKLKKWDFESFVIDYFEKNNLNLQNIEATNFYEDSFYIHLDNGTIIDFTIDNIKKYLLNINLKGDKLKDLEKRSNNIQDAIESIYIDNNGIFFNGEIDDDDFVKTNKYGEDLKGKTLKQLKELLELENEKLFGAYDIIGESSKKNRILKNELKFYTGLGDKYEGGARYFSMSEKDINEKVSRLVNGMDFNDLVSYIIDTNRVLSENYKTSKMVEQVNSKFLRLLYLHTIEKFKKQNASNKDFINLIKALTGRGALKINGDVEYHNQTNFEYSSLEINDGNKDNKLVNELLIYLMYKKGGVLEELANKKMMKVKVEDKEIKGRSSKIIVDEVVGKLNGIYKQNVGEELLKKAGFNSLLNIDKHYNELSYEEKISLGALARILNVFNESSDEDLLNPNFIKNKSLESVQDSLDELNENLSSNFDESLLDWNGINSKDLNLTGELAEIYELYQDINGNKGIFDWKDKNTFTPGAGTVVMGIGLIAGVYFMGPLLVGQGALLTGMALFKAGALAGAKLGFVTGVASNSFSHQGYDSYDEAIVDVSSQILVDTVASAGFSALGLPIIKRFGNINPDLLFSKQAWTSASGIADKGFIAGEVGLTGMVLSPAVGTYVEGEFSKNHKDTDNILDK
ncbi:MAG: hypothetical protein Q8K30_04885 [Candidatus Gracilibacteria bacterium]|nr:hypothetical protein [Candidatus Gracilibacteria bacterium]